MDEPKKDNQSKLVQQLMDQLNKARTNKNPNKDQPERYQRMGLPEDWCKPSMVFVRAFRWTLTAPNHDKISTWVVKINVNYKEKLIELSAYEDLDGNVHEWITDMIGDAASRQIVINHFDGCGHLLFNNTYSGIEVKDHKVEYDYSLSDVLTHKLKLSYRHIKRSSNLTVN